MSNALSRLIIRLQKGVTPQKIDMWIEDGQKDKEKDRLDIYVDRRIEG